MKNHVLTALTILFLVAGCAHGKVGLVGKQLNPGAVSASRMISVDPISLADTTFSGDKAGDAKRVAEEKNEIQYQFNHGIADQLRKHGFSAQAVPSPQKTGLVLSGKVTKYEHGSAAARIFIGMGAGSSNLFTSFELKDYDNKTTLANFEIIATSGGNGGLQASGSYLAAHLIDGAEKTAEYMAKSNGFEKGKK